MALNAMGLLTSSARGAEPTSWRHPPQKPAFTLTWHHIIPWNQLAAVWNGLIAGAHWSAARTFLQLASVPDIDGAIRQIRSGMLVRQDELHSRLTWQGWNIVEGPGKPNRADDPDEGYDSFSLSKGVSGNQRGTLQAVAALHLVVQRLAGLPRGIAPGGVSHPVIPAADAQALERAMTAQMHELRGKSPIPWNEAMWQPVVVGVVDRRLPAVWQTVPVWRKA